MPDTTFADHFGTNGLDLLNAALGEYGQSITLDESYANDRVNVRATVSNLDTEAVLGYVGGYSDAPGEIVWYSFSTVADSMGQGVLTRCLAACAHWVADNDFRMSIQGVGPTWTEDRGLAVQSVIDEEAELPMPVRPPFFADAEQAQEVIDAAEAKLLEDSDGA